MTGLPDHRPGTRGGGGTSSACGGGGGPGATSGATLLRRRLHDHLCRRWRRLDLPHAPARASTAGATKHT